MNTLSEMYGRSPAPLYAQVASVMRQRIESGHWAKGDKISTLEELGAEFSVARVTIRQAVELLRDEGLLDVQQGRGTFVCGLPERDRWLNLGGDLKSMVASIKDNVIEHFHVEQAEGSPVLEPHEGAPASAYMLLRSVQYNKGVPFSAVSLHLDREVFDRAPDYFAHSAALPRVAAMEDLDLVNAFQMLTIGIASPETASLLNIGLGEPTLDCRLVLRNKAGVAVYVADINYHKDCFALRVDLLNPGSGLVPPARG